MHKLLQRVNPNDPQMFKYIGALMFLSHKYEPYDGEVYLCETLIERLFGKQTTVTKNQIIDFEELAFELLDYSLVVVTPYDFIHLFIECTNFSQKQSMLALYLASLSMMSVKCQNYDQCKVAAAITMLVLNKSG
jgi:hypothetical protein